MESIHLKYLFFCLFLMLSIFAIDLQLPLGVAGGVPYISVILVSLWLPGKRYIISFAILCSLLVIAGYYFSPLGGEHWKVIFNRSLALFAIWVTVIIAIKWKLSEKKVFKITQDAEKEKEKIYMATIYGAQHITNNLLNELQLVKIEIENNSDFDKDVSSMFDNMLAETNTLMKQLSDVHDINERTIKESVYPKTLDN